MYKKTTIIAAFLLLPYVSFAATWTNTGSNLTTTDATAAPSFGATCTSGLNCEMWLTHFTGNYLKLKAQDFQDRITFNNSIIISQDDGSNINLDLQNNGNVGVGTSSPWTTFSVTGTGYFSANLYDAGVKNCAVLGTDATGKINCSVGNATTSSSVVVSIPNLEIYLVIQLFMMVFFGLIFYFRTPSNLIR